MPVNVEIRKNETLEKALRRLKKKLDREDIIKDAKDKRYFSKPSAKLREKKKMAAFNNMLRQKRKEW